MSEQQQQGQASSEEAREPETGDIFSSATGEHVGYLNDDCKLLDSIESAMNIQVLVKDKWYVYKLHEVIKKEAGDVEG